MHKLPAIFLGHGSPMNAIDPTSRFNRAFLEVAAQVEKPQAILMISAHWYGRSLEVMSGEFNPILYDFYGFPEALYQADYPAKGSPQLAQQVMDLLADFNIKPNPTRGLDHGAWAVLRHFYPQADIPVVQLSLNLSQPPLWHWQVAQALRPLREQGILIMASGNIVHNLPELDFRQIDKPLSYEWAEQFRVVINRAIQHHDVQTLLNYPQLGSAAQLAVPPPAEHYLPLLYVIVQRDEGEPVQIFNDEIVGGALSMTSVKVGG